ncbi:Highly reducing polyketide synthase [Bienertia sinuspersici]
MLEGKLLMDRTFNFEAMKRTLRSVWRLKDEVAVRMINSNLFVFQFLTIADKKKVMQGSPWFLDNQLLLLNKVNGDERISEHDGVSVVDNNADGLSKEQEKVLLLEINEKCHVNREENDGVNCPTDYHANRVQNGDQTRAVDRGISNEGSHPLNPNVEGNKQSKWRRIPRDSTKHQNDQNDSFVKPNTKKRDSLLDNNNLMEIDDFDRTKKHKDGVSPIEAEDNGVAGAGMNQPREQQ